MNKKSFKVVDRQIEFGIEQGIFPGAVVLCSLGGKIVYHKSFGHADVFEKRVMVKDSIFDLASLTKPLATALAISRLIETGQLSLTQQLGDILMPFKKTQKANITIDMLLRHTSGLPAHREYFKPLMTIGHNRTTALRNMLVKEDLENKPGVIQLYSDLGYMILAWVIETITGKSIDQYVDQEIYQPLNTENLFYIPLESKNKILEKYGRLIVPTQQCPWRKQLMYGEVDDDNTWAVGGVDGHAGLFADATSVFNICSEILNALIGEPTRLISSQVLKAMVIHKDGHDMVAGFDTPSKEKSSAGKFFSDQSIGHLGFTGTSFWIDPKKHLIVIFLTNRVHPSRANNLLKSFRPKLHNLICEQLL